MRTLKLDTGVAAIASDHLPVRQDMELLRPSVTGLRSRTGRSFRSPISFGLWQDAATLNRLDGFRTGLVVILDVRGKEYRPSPGMTEGAWLIRPVLLDRQDRSIPAD